MVHHTEWDRKVGMQGDNDEMDEIIKEMAPGGSHYHAFKDGSVKSDAQILHDGVSTKVVHKGAAYDHSLPSLYHGKWYDSDSFRKVFSSEKSEPSFFMSVIRVMSLLLVLFICIKILGMVMKAMKIPKSKSRSKKSRSR